ncbi:unknown protein [Grouper iridovirus]|uniref:Uncharacterized protein n=1 Tax=Grouper iridovirus TaxID=127569 RepID=Q5GAH5_9VIRU|nr:unknown protein [Grouper iridovirus]
MIRSGTTPSLSKGMSSCDFTAPHVPFCAVNEANLSPISGILGVRNLTLTILRPSGSTSCTILSKYPSSEALTVRDISLHTVVPVGPCL